MLSDDACTTSITERIAELIRRQQLIPPGGEVLTMLSGGADSTLLCLVLCELGYAARALHVSHGLRGAESTADAATCAALCTDLGVPLVVVDGRVRPGPNLEARLRDIRLEAALAARGDAPVATGHTASDRAETILYRLATSGGVNALPALTPARGVFIRPLIEHTRQQVRDELRRRGVAWRDDASNRDTRFARNRVRHRVLAELEVMNPAAARNIARAGAAAAEQRDLIDQLAADLLAGDGSLDLDRLAAAHPALARAAIRLAADGAGVRVGHDDTEALLRLGRDGSARRSLPGGACAQRCYNRLWFQRGDEVVVVPSPVGLSVGATVTFGSIEVRSQLGSGAAITTQACDRLAVRAWRHGDRLAGHARSCARLMQAARVPRPLRERFPIIVVDDEPVAVAGIAVADTWRRRRGILITTHPAYPHACR